jgi:putative LysE/RhtB family amino acid efflux pump
MGIYYEMFFDAMNVFLEACLMGFAIAAPIGPIGLICIQKTLVFGLRGSLAVGIGATLANGIYGFIAATGITTLSQFLIDKMIYLEIIGGLFLLLLAYHEVKAKKKRTIHSTNSKNLYILAINVLFLTLANPMAILLFIGVFASISPQSVSINDAYWMTAGIMVGSILWWMILGNIVVAIKGKIPEKWLHRIHYASAFVLAGFGIGAIVTAILKM